MDMMGFVSNIGAIQAVLFIVGLALVFVEMFLPGFGVAGITGIILLIIGIIITAKTVFEALIMILILLAILGVAFFLVFRSATKGKLSKSLVLSDSINKSSGYSSVDEYKSMVGKEGIALSVLRPSGIADFDGVKLDVVTEGEYIPSGTKIKIIQVSGPRIVVREVK
ncbi:MAG TPA: hypothetical protein GXX36_04675 [Clostridiaceae bacterium]|nr:hypothetical protein [Clostridiaceae bacterium]